MTVKELRDILDNYPDDAEVRISSEASECVALGAELYPFDHEFDGVLLCADVCDYIDF